MKYLVKMIESLLSDKRLYSKDEEEQDEYIDEIVAIAATLDGPKKLIRKLYYEFEDDFDALSSKFASKIADFHYRLTSNGLENNLADKIVIALAGRRNK